VAEAIAVRPADKTTDNVRSRNSFFIAVLLGKWIDFELCRVTLWLRFFGLGGPRSHHLTFCPKDEKRA